VAVVEERPLPTLALVGADEPALHVRRAGEHIRENLGMPVEEVGRLRLDIDEQFRVGDERVLDKLREPFDVHALW
jgi:hypothetical protein